MENKKIKKSELVQEYEDSVKLQKKSLSKSPPKVKAAVPYVKPSYENLYMMLQDEFLTLGERKKASSWSFKDSLGRIRELSDAIINILDIDKIGWVQPKSKK